MLLIMANQYNGHRPFAAEPWRAILSNNSTGLESDDIITSTIYRLLDEEMESCRRTYGEASRKEKPKWAPEEQLKLLVGVASSTPPKKPKWAAEEQLKLIVGVASSTLPKTGRKDWKRIEDNYFKDSKRKENNKLKQKWKELKKHAENKKDDSQKEFYMMVAIVEAKTQRKPDEKIKFDNVIKEWSGALKKQDQVIMARAQQKLTTVKWMEPQQQLQKIRDWVTEAQQCHAYGNIPYWELSSGILHEPGTAA
ncbi:unnamed protein product [Camellia sinensis]